MPRTTLLLLAGLAAGCGGAGVPAGHPQPRGSESCILGHGARERTGLVGATDPRDSALLGPARAGIPVALDCGGVPRPRLASTWSRDSAGSAWTLTVPDAAALTARWRAEPAARTLREAGATSLVPLDGHRIVITFDRPHPELPRVFSDPALAGPTPDNPETIAVRDAGPDLRDALDQADVVLTADPVVVGLAGTRRDWSAHPLPWNRTYVLLAPGGIAVDIPSGDSAGWRASLASEAVRAAARGAERPYWWEQAGCPPGAARSVGPPRTVLYALDDAVARGLAERLVAVSGAPGMVARGVPRTALAASLTRGDDAAFILDLPRDPPVPCRELAGWPAGATVLPLIDTRLTALLRRGTGRLLTDFDGGLLPVPEP